MNGGTESSKHGYCDLGGPYVQLDALLRFAEASLRNVDTTNRRVLDLCCGAGLTIQHFANANWDVVGFDQCASLLHAARQRQPQHGTSSRYQLIEEIELFLTQAEKFELVVGFDDLATELADPDTLSTTLAIAWDALSRGGHFVFQFDRSLNVEDSDVLAEARRIGFSAVWTASPALLDTPCSLEHRGDRALVVARRDL